MEDKTVSCAAFTRNREIATEVHGQHCILEGDSAVDAAAYTHLHLRSGGGA